MNRRIINRTGLVLALTLAVAGSALAGGTPSGTPVDNTATVDYVVGGLPQATINSNTASFLVDNRVDVQVATLDAANIVVVPGMLARVLTFSVTNSGNTVQDYTLTAVPDLTDDFEAANVNVFVDQNANGSYDPGTDTADYLDELGIDVTATVFIVADIPLGPVDADLANYDLLAETSVGATPGTQGGVIAGDASGSVDDPLVVQIVFADAAGIGDAPFDGSYSSRSTYEVAAADLQVVKTHAVNSDPINGAANPKNIPGATLDYSTALNNGGGTSADNVLVVDPVPAATSFIVGSHTVAPAGTVSYSDDGGATWTYVPTDSGDGTDPNLTHMRILFASIAAAGTATSSFQVIIQ